MRRGYCGLIMLPLILTGCSGSQIHAELRQARAATQAERQLPLDSREACFHLEDGRAVYLFDLPLPGATAAPQYRLYLRLADSTGRHTIGTSLEHGGFEAGFLIHLKGRGAGLTECVSGTIDVDPPHLGHGNQRAGELSLRFADGSHLTGRFTADNNSDRVLRYERDSAEVQALLRGFRLAGG